MTQNFGKTVFQVGIGLVLLSFSGCSPSNQETSQKESAPLVPVLHATLSADKQSATDQYGNKLAVYEIGKKQFIEADATYSPQEFMSLNTPNKLKRASEKTASQLQSAGAIVLSQTPELGYFDVLIPFEENLLSVLRTIKFAHTLYINPIVYDDQSLKTIRQLRTHSVSMKKHSNGRGGSMTAGYSGLEPIKAPEFVKLLETSLGLTANGSSVKLGISDTGITYNHPAFISQSTSKNRITYMKDFTREGRVYFNPNAKFSVVFGEGTSAKINAEVISTPKNPAFPTGDTFVQVEDLEIQVSPELKAALTAAGNTAKLGFLNEAAFQSDQEPVDLNSNGSTTDALPMLFIPGATHADGVVYFDQSGTGNFTDVTPLQNWNTSQTTVDVFSEKIGFAIQNDQLPDKAGLFPVNVTSASIVGFDPGNHGSHVAGIAAGSIPLVRGVAPEAQLLMNRVCANNGGCNATRAIVDLAIKGGAEVINMSLGGLGPYNDGFGVQETIVNRLTSEKNVLVVISAGNSGPGRQTIGSPSTARLSLSVGAAASKEMIRKQYQWPGLGASEGSDDFMLFFSSRGPTAAGGFKPNVTAPGTELSSIQLNPADGSRGGLDVYWGTSMSAPTVTGAYALFLDAVKKYNTKFPDQMLTTSAQTLRSILIDSARPFDVNRLDVQTGKKQTGQYTWVDQGNGMIDLPAAWAKILTLRDQNLPTSIQLATKPIDLDYQVMVSATGPNGIKYDGSSSYDIDGNGTRLAPKFGTGLYLDYYGMDTFRQVSIQRALPEHLTSVQETGELNRQLLTTGDEFVLRTIVYGSDVSWIKAGTLAQLDCWDSETYNLNVLGKGVDVEHKADGTAELMPFRASTLNVCINRELIKNTLKPGDHGALISGYRTVGGKISAVPSFTVPVYLAVPHKILADSTAYEVEKTVKSFGVIRNYVTVPTGTRIVRVSLEVPAFKAGTEGCQGVELMALEGGNTLKPSETRAQLRIANCSDDGSPSNASRTLVITRKDPKPGMWDLHVFGRYQFNQSKFKLRVDYLVAESSVKKLEGGTEILSGNFDWTVKESSVVVAPDSTKSKFEIFGLQSKTEAQVAKDASIVVPSPIGTLRSYPENTQKVVVTTGGSPGNDIDLAVLECDSTAQDQSDVSCKPIGSSGGSADDEVVSFKPRSKKVYAVLVMGFEIKDDGKFTSTETLSLNSERGQIIISGSQPKFRIEYQMSQEQQAKSVLLQHPLFKPNGYKVVGALNLISENEISLDSIPVLINAK